MADLNYFALDWNQAAEVLGAIVMLAIFIERGLTLVFENDWYRKRFGDRRIKEAIAFIVALLACVAFRFDAVGILMKQESWSVIGLVLTAGVIAGGSKASIKVFTDVFGIRNLTPEEDEQKRELQLQNMRKMIAEADEATAIAAASAKKKAGKKANEGGS